MIREREVQGLPGVPMVLWLIVGLAAGLYGIVRGIPGDDVWLIVWSCIGVLLVVFFMAGLFVVNPNEGRVLQFFGDYAGTVRVAGLRWANPLFTKKRISLRVRNFESGRLKVNDNEGNPVEIAAVVVWQVVDTAEAMFEVDDYNNYV